MFTLQQREPVDHALPADLPSIPGNQHIVAVVANATARGHGPIQRGGVWAAPLSVD
jgi:hypothetical protein